MRETGLDILGKVPWGTHFCQFYKNKEDLIEILVPYFKAGLKNNEFCMWITSNPLKAKEAKNSLWKELEDLDDYIEKGQIEILDASQWYGKSGRFNSKKILAGLVKKEEEAVERGFDGIRIAGNTFWLEKEDWRSFAEYEEMINSIINNYRMLAICSYSQDRCGANELIEVANSHQFSIIKHEAKWKFIESSEHKRVHETLQQNELFNFILFQYNPIETMVTDRNGRVIRVNSAAKRSGKKLPGIGDVMYKDWPEKPKIDMHAELMECIRLGNIKNFPEVKHGDQFFFITSAGFPKGAIVTYQDITERKRAEEEKEKLQAQLIQSEKIAGIGTLTSGIAHEFNNLLQIMTGHAEFARRTKKPEDMEEALEIVENTSERVSRIIKDLLTFSRRKPLDRERCNIAELVELVLSMIEEQLKKHNIKVVKEYRKTPSVEVNEGELQQVFLNMITNARDAMTDKGGKLEIKVKKVNDNAEVSFTDTGIGIEEENLGRVFEPFYTTKGAVGEDTRTQGIGLGLSVSYGIVERHGGTIEIASEVGRGTTFTVKLPVKGKEVKKSRAKVARKAKKKMPEPQKILVVDDEKAICQMFTKWLSSEGHQVKSALTGKTAISLVKKESFDVVFLDIVMPGISGVEVLERIKEISPKTKVIMITGSLLKKDTWDGLKQKGASGYIQKPFKMEDITKCLEF